MSRSSDADRRRFSRKSSRDCPWLVDARLRSGTEVRVVDISNGGMLLESASQILPGARIELFLVTQEQRWLVRGRILRCQVARLVREDGVRYHAALVFNEPLAIFDEADDLGEQRAIATDLRPPIGRVRAFAVPAPIGMPAAALEAAS
jgi:hypothetical protein